MEVIIKKNYDEMSKEAAKVVKKRILKKLNLVLGLATGSTPLGLYQELVRMHKEEDLSFKKVKTFNLDEYYGLDPDHPQSYRYFMNANLFSQIDIDLANTHVPDGLAKDIGKYCLEYEEEIEKYGGIDLQVLGIGSDGHIGFNEPGSSLGSRTRIKTLNEQTVADNSRFFKNIDEVPKYAITMGVGTIIDAKEIILLASGKNKSRVVAQAIEGPVTSQITASMLQVHPKVMVILDEDAASLLKKRDYYKFVVESVEKF
ncbi:MAG: glucosamine-6-phosphate deaminase [bacterium (Candidatus Ratteibacteria) CG_4_10_14_3_um_filter_41_18]|uniref:Glucosamine-6-phosphate deaminase n=4 Tax=Candidatus Ratteibacteria TaxID=2979319 RepID=A0A2M7E947_9BACT|nr:MAG: glucosamine-6-phosphate deaminase [Candidatus Omnitrophica bacterium CG1_02_41_171]PIV64267.1 MAG: glucosamine-6-phosphate deaminase [bacterium (Candidatus Ratteibacteria) CG01_land_8_20_14_3_00_40_19]PIW33962.1 MAG: glucosamine-6-phosphate deaminase [bacterium (Candidatus Ratteibacteria) CG15_BIG_FIL_POST_REV_8_21_14_020_41_12]PIW73804.1 MAG: glucosamine-6-phosphate deaminase [bacterium (Candidatus Ratteibacteria) CG_4_8_14_3_um_filter_41_36]PIX76789.1 MAG: glucosamine-6-phosphate deam